MRIAVARAISIVGHPVVFVPIAALIAASALGASPQQLRLIGGAVLALGVVVLGFSTWQVRRGRWAHVDASARSERKSLNVFLAVLLLLSAALLWFLTHQTYMPVALAISSGIIVTALLLARWVRVSLHAAFAAFATVLLWPIKLAFAIGVLATAAVVWSRLVLGRHIAADIVAALLLGAVAGGAYLAWVLI